MDQRFELLLGEKRRRKDQRFLLGPVRGRRVRAFKFRQFDGFRHEIHGVSRHVHGLRLRVGPFVGRIAKIDHQRTARLPGKLLRFLNHRLERVLTENRQSGVKVEIPHVARLPIDLNRDVTVQPDERLAQARGLGAVQKVFFLFRRLRPKILLQIFRLQNLLKAPEPQEQILGGFRPDQRDPRHIIRRVPHERLVVHNLLRRDPPVFQEKLAVKVKIPPDAENRDRVGNELARVFVARHQHALPAELRHALGHRRQNVIRLEPLERQHRNFQRVEQFPDARDLPDQLLRHFFPRGFVVGIELRAERRRVQVERTKQKVRLLMLQDHEQVARETEHGVHDLAAFAIHRRQGVENLVHEAVSVDHENFLIGQVHNILWRNERREKGFNHHLFFVLDVLFGKFYTI